MECAKCDRLMVECERAGISYTTAMKALVAGHGMASSSSEYIKLRTATDSARSDYEIARLELDRHELTHGDTVWN